MGKLGPNLENERSFEINRNTEVDKIVKQLKENMSAPVLRLKMTVGSVKSVSDQDGNKYQEELFLNAVYSSVEGSANQQWSKWTPAASLNMSISNPHAFGKLLPGQFVYVDLTPCEKDSL